MARARKPALRVFWFTDSPEQRAEPYVWGGGRGLYPGQVFGRSGLPLFKEPPKYNKYNIGVNTFFNKELLKIN